MRTLKLVLAITLCAIPPLSGEDTFRARAERGDVVAQLTLGIQYSVNWKNHVEAAKWFRRAAEQGDELGQQLLAQLYVSGKGVPQDFAEAARWLSYSAEQGFAPSQEQLGIAYLRGTGVPQDYVQAHKWLNLAASREADDLRAISAKGRDIVADQMTKEQVAEAQRLAREWKPKTWEELSR